MTDLLTRRGDADRVARAAWTRLAEPGDEAAGAAIAALGAAGALEHVLAGRRLPPEVLEHWDAGSPARLDRALARWRTRVDVLAPDRDLDTVARFGGRFVTPEDPEWPGGVDDLDLARPYGLWVLGQRPLGPAVGAGVSVVGARAATAYGLTVATDLAAGLAARGLTVVSGAAFGVDAAAHRGALAAPGLTVAVLACGVDRFYPMAHEGLLRTVAAEGLVVAEVAPGTTVMRDRLLQRNRLIAALTRGTVVVEAGVRSGALVTARHAATLGRALGAVPGPVGSAASAGCHVLLREYGAVCVTDADEVAELVRPIGVGPTAADRAPSAPEEDLPPQQARVLESLPVRRPVGVDSLVRVAGLPRPDVEQALAGLYLAGLAEFRTGADGQVWRRT